ncbi:glutamine--fructose-6-phosphate aminotransferase [isomerizing] [Actinocatenispora thailandica]|uniref:Glutamine--fructose-6-phosphate aminotransferase [isomerizing] n=1 Tax=Actinocatenispora thailandica TaxID=227318 RepID=A0A7R7DU65_9ACTN|nr:glutamine--fructose-6-phosphate transaminase (isomerizing) [Actinocatenispora thailandica]BCJ37831.1 glutamine--fructose-6-phosphate aminotransferase [isomerizing] [Actinocatenispora thailandica]
MCGIVGYVGARPACTVVVDGLRRLEYRGYDSAGVAVVADDEVRVVKRAGKLTNLTKALAELPPADRMRAAVSGIGHTRWATHGAPTDRNAHPHASADGRVAVIHNGIIENFARLRDELEAAGVELASDTDSEVVAHLLAAELARTAVPAGVGAGAAAVAAGGAAVGGRGTADEVAAPVGAGALDDGTAGALEDGAAGTGLVAAMRAVCARLTGAFTLLAVSVDEPGLVVGARRNSPLVVGVGAGEYFLASDVSAFIEHTRDAVELGQDQVVAITADGYQVTDFAGTPAVTQQYHVDWDAGAAEKGGYDYFMLKEIAEQPKAVADTLRGRLTEAGEITLDEVRLSDQDLRDVDKIFIVACGTAYHAGLVAKYAIEHWTRIPCEVELASEFRYRDPVLDRSTLVVAISQSGETMDTIMALRHAKVQKARVLAISNTNGSTIPRESDAVLYTHAGPEVAVASTKAFLTQLVACYLVGLHLAQVRGIKYADEVAAVVAQLTAMPSKVDEVLAIMEPVRELGRSLGSAPSVLFIGRHVGYPVALEGALKLKELAYMHAEGFAAGELKHGPIALIDNGTPVICVLPSPRGRAVLHDKMISNIQEVRARGARVVAIAEEGDTAVAPHADHVVYVPRTPTLLAPLVTTVPLQVLAAEIATTRGHDVDQPRNLAKSVTVE